MSNMVVVMVGGGEGCSVRPYITGARVIGRGNTPLGDCDTAIEKVSKSEKCQYRVNENRGRYTFFLS